MAKAVVSAVQPGGGYWFLQRGPPTPTSLAYPRPGDFWLKKLGGLRGRFAHDSIKQVCVQTNSAVVETISCVSGPWPAASERRRSRKRGRIITAFRTRNGSPA